jgi:acyl dehydratase
MGQPLRPRTLADLEALLQRELGPTPWHVLEQDEIDAFATLTGDHQWIHVDPERAAHGPFGRTIGHGLLTLSLGPALTSSLLSLDNFAYALNYGFDKVRFPQARPVGTRLAMTATVVDVRRTDPGCGLVAIRQTFLLEGATKPVCVADSLAYVTERPTVEADRS